MKTKNVKIRDKKAYFFQCAAGTCFLIISLLLNYAANLYATARASGAVHDLILDNVRPINVTAIFLEGALIFVICLLIFAIVRPTRLPFMLKSVALFYLIRSFFIILTHLSPPYGEIDIPAGNAFHFLSLGNDLFFSGHTGLPFLMTLTFWENVRYRWIFLVLTLFFGTAALLGHLHYSIDVFAAFFIAYGIFHIAILIWPSEWKRLRKGEGWEAGSGGTI